jgi:hypothetical protein
MSSRCVFLLCVLLSACSTGSDEPRESRDDMTQRQRDSTIAESRLPGAPAVGRALEASDAAAARAAAADSIR